MIRKKVLITHNHSVGKYAFRLQGSTVRFERGHKYTPEYNFTPRRVKMVHRALSEMGYVLEDEIYHKDFTFFGFAWPRSK